MSKVKGIAWEHVRNELMSNPEVQAAYEAEERKERLQAMLAEWRHHAGLTRARGRTHGCYSTYRFSHGI